jgi:ribose 5-phosphate isomerase B
MRIYAGSDHAAFELKNTVVEHLRSAGHDVVDCGPATYDAADDYPVFILRTALGVAGDPGSLGIVLGGSGNGEQIAANKVRGVRAALAFSEETAQLAREHNNANVLSLGARMYDEKAALSYVDVFVNTPFSEDPRHIRRIEMITAYESDGSLPPLPDST